MDARGLVVAGGALGLAVLVGLYRRRVDGRFRPVDHGSATRSPLTGQAALVPPEPSPPVPPEPSQSTVSSMAADTAVGRGGRPGGGAETDDGEVDQELLRALGVTPGVTTLLQFSSAFCAPCRATRRVCADVAALLPQVQHVEVDAESHLDAVRALAIWRTPTVLVLDAGGRIVRRATGVPAKAQVVAVLGEVLTA